MHLKWRQRKFSDDEGSSLILIIFSAALSLAVILAVMSVTSAYIEHKRLLSLADGAALSAAESFSLESVSMEQGNLTPTLTNSEVYQAARSYTSKVTRSGGTRAQLARAYTSDGRSATVEMTSQWQPPVISLLVPEGFTIRASSTSRTIW